MKALILIVVCAICGLTMGSTVVKPLTDAIKKIETSLKK